MKKNKNKKQQKQTAVSNQGGAKGNQNKGAVSKAGVCKKKFRRGVGIRKRGAKSKAQGLMGPEAQPCV